MENASTHRLSDPEMVAPRLIALREALELNKTEFARMIDVDKSSYTKIEKGDKPLLPPAAYRIWENWTVDMNYIYLGQLKGLPSDLSSKVISRLRGHQA